MQSRLAVSRVGGDSNLRGGWQQVGGEIFTSPGPARASRARDIRTSLCSRGRALRPLSRIHAPRDIRTSLCSRVACSSYRTLTLSRKRCLLYTSCYI